MNCVGSSCGRKRTSVLSQKYQASRNHNVQINSTRIKLIQFFRCVALATGPVADFKRDVYMCVCGSRQR